MVQTLRPVSAKQPESSDIFGTLLCAKTLTLLFLINSVKYCLVTIIVNFSSILFDLIQK